MIDHRNRRLQVVSPIQIAKVVAALGERCKGVQLNMDGSVMIWTSDPSLTPAKEEEIDTWAGV